MTEKNEGGLFDYLLPDFSKDEKLIRKLSNICEEHFLVFRIIKYPIIFNRPQWRILITTMRDKKHVILFEKNDMSFETILRSAIKYMEDYKIKHKSYNLSKGGEDYL